MPRSDVCQFAYMYAQPACDIWSALWEFRDSIVAALTHCHVLATKDLLCLNSHPKACHIVNVKDNDHLKQKHRPISVYIALIMLIESALMF